MITHEGRYHAESLRQMIYSGYLARGDAYGHALAGRCAWIVGEVVTDVHGRAKAVAMLDSVSDAINAKEPTSPTMELDKPSALVGIDGATLADRWIIPAPKVEEDLKPIFEMIAAHFYQAQRMAKLAAAGVVIKP